MSKDNNNTPYIERLTNQGVAYAVPRVLLGSTNTCKMTQLPRYPLVNILVWLSDMDDEDARISPPALALSIASEVDYIRYLRESYYYSVSMLILYSCIIIGPLVTECDMKLILLRICKLYLACLGNDTRLSL